jgi:hypothetical protein
MVEVETIKQLHGQIEQLMLENELLKARINELEARLAQYKNAHTPPSLEPTNNRADRALRPHVVLRKILGTLRNDKGTSIHERIMTTLATWGQKGLNSLQMLTTKLAS